jgi:hypothetical protein
MKIDNLDHIRFLQNYSEKLINSDPFKISNFITGELYDRHCFQGVYAISDPDDKTVVYIGKTDDGIVENGLADRIHGHSSSNSTLQKALGVNAVSFRDFLVRSICVDDPVQRGYIEYYAIAIYRPKANKVGRI